MAPPALDTRAIDVSRLPLEHLHDLFAGELTARERLEDIGK